MEITLKDINEILKDAPKNVLNSVFGYIESLLETKNTHFELTENQKKNLQEIKSRSYSEHTEVESFVSEMKSKYEI